MSVRSDATASQDLWCVDAFSYNAAYTMTGWFKCDDTTVKCAIVKIDQSDVTYNYDGVCLDLTTSRHPYAAVRIAGSATRQEGADSLSDNTWYFWALRRTGATSLELRIGTTSETTITTNVTGRTASIYVSLFSISGEGAATLKGSMAQCRIWTTNLTDGELVTEMNSTTAVKTASLWAEWRMVNLAGIATDSSGNGRSLNVNGTFTTGADNPVQGTAVPYNRRPLFGPLLAQ